MSNPKIIINGRVGTIPEAMGSGVRFRVVTNDRVKNDRGDWEDRDISWWTVKAWKRLAEYSQILQKGQEVTIIGTIYEDKWKDNSGTERSTYEVVADDISVTLFSLTKGMDLSKNKISDNNFERSPW